MIATDKQLFEELGIRLQDYCVCGRSTSAIHCPRCGSTDVRGSIRHTKSASVLLPTGLRRQVNAFTCRRCSKPFQENDCFRDCRAFVVNWRSENKTADDVKEQVKHGGPIPQVMRDALVQLAKKHPKYRQTIQDKLAESGPGLLERVDVERGESTVDERSPLDIADEERKRNKPLDATAKLFEPPVLASLDEESDK